MTLAPAYIDYTRGRAICLPLLESSLLDVDQRTIWLMIWLYS